MACMSKQVVECPGRRPLPSTGRMLFGSGAVWPAGPVTVWTVAAQPCAALLQEQSSHGVCSKIIHGFKFDAHPMQPSYRREVVYLSGACVGELAPKDGQSQTGIPVHICTPPSALNNLWEN